MQDFCKNQEIKDLFKFMMLNCGDEIREEYRLLSGTGLEYDDSFHGFELMIDRNKNYSLLNINNIRLCSITIAKNPDKFLYGVEFNPNIKSFK